MKWPNTQIAVLWLSDLDQVETKHGGSKNGKKEGLSGSSFFTWFMVIALLGVWTSVAVVWFELVDYEEVLAKAKDFRYNLSEVLQGLTKDGSNENIDSLEEVLNILAEESSDWFYGFLSFLYDVITPFDILEEEESDATDDVDGHAPGEVAKKKAKEKVKDIKEQVKKVKEKQELKKESKEEEKKKAKKKDDLDRKEKKVADVDKSRSDKVKRDRKAEKERLGQEKNAKNKEVASGKEVKKAAKTLSKLINGSAKEEEKKKKLK
ncbi:hypothetical protein lerEdw1_008967 [Lerista edwardsae]|nr:hypothetical protein lerEdw1_008967 [Lerista edwardsae]